MSGGASPPRRDDGASIPNPTGTRRDRLTASGGTGPTRGRVALDAARRHLHGVAGACAAAGDLPPAAAALRERAMGELDAAMDQHDAFLDAAAHDLRNPLTAIKGQVQLLRRRARRAADGNLGSVRLEAGLADIDFAVARLTALIDELLDRRHEGGGER